MQSTIPDLLVQICKLGGVLWTAAFGIMGLLVTFRDERTQRVTKWGRIALSGIVVSTTLGVVGQLLEHTLEIESLSESVGRQEKILLEINRQNHSFTADAQIITALRFPKDHPVTKEYLDDCLDNCLMPLFNDIIEEYGNRGSWYNPKYSQIYVDGHTGPEGNQVDKIWLPVPHDILFPKEAIKVSLEVGVYEGSVSVNDVDLSLPASAGKPYSEVSFALSSNRLEAGRLHYFPSREIFVFEFRAPPGHIRTAFAPMSILDLQDKLLVVGILGEENATISLVGIQFRLSSGVAVTIGSEAFEATSNSWPDVSHFAVIDDLDQTGQWPVEYILP